MTKYVLIVVVLLLGFFVGNKLDQVMAPEPYVQELKPCGIKTPKILDRFNTSTCKVSTTDYGWPFVASKEHTVIESSRIVKAITQGSIVERQEQNRVINKISFNTLLVIVLLGAIVLFIFHKKHKIIKR